MLTGRIAALPALLILVSVLPARAAWADKPPKPIVVHGDESSVDTTVTSPGQSQSTVQVAAAPQRTCHSVEVQSPKAGVAPFAEVRNGYWGIYFLTYCSDGTSSIDWVPQYPVGPTQPVAPAATTTRLAQTAVDHLPFPRALVHHSPNRIGGRPSTVVGVQTWWWLDPRSYRTITHHVRAGGTWATVTARPVSTYWKSGSADAPNVHCDGPGTPYDTSKPADAQRTDCFTVYRRSSANQPQSGPDPNDRYFTASVTVTWQVTWVGAGAATGSLPPLSRTSTFPIAVAEVQAVNK